MKIINLGLSLLFMYFTLVQFNDPDSYLWVGLYILITGIFALAVFGKYQKYVVYAAMAICTIGLLLTIGSVVKFFTNEDGITLTEGMSNSYLYIEESREFGGLLITLLALLFLTKQKRD